MKKKTAKKSAAKKNGFFREAGEVIGSIGHGLLEGKDKVVEMSQAVIEGISHSIAPLKKKVAKKVSAKKATAKKAAKKIVAKKVTKKAAVKKVVAKKAAVKKVVKKAAPKKAVKKVATKKVVKKTAKKVGK